MRMRDSARKRKNSRSEAQVVCLLCMCCYHDISQVQYRYISSMNRSVPFISLYISDEVLVKFEVLYFPFELIMGINPTNWQRDLIPGPGASCGKAFFCQLKVGSRDNKLIT